MNAHAPLPLDAPADPAADLAAWGEGVLLRQSAMLEQLAEAALRMALAIERSVTEAPAEGQSPVAVTEAAIAFGRVSRAMRMTALLQSRLIKERQAIEESPARQAALAQAAEAAKIAERNDPVNVHKARVEAVVERVAKAACGDDEDELDRLVMEAGERLDDDDIYGEVLSRPVGELVALICRDLGLEPDWRRLGEEAWAVEEATNGDPRSPFVATSPIAEAMAGGGPSAERSEEPMVEGAGGWQSLSAPPFESSPFESSS